jgi:hypothetical protein
VSIFYKNLHRSPIDAIDLPMPLPSASIGTYACISATDLKIQCRVAVAGMGKVLPIGWDKRFINIEIYFKYHGR